MRLLIGGYRDMHPKFKRSTFAGLVACLFFFPARTQSTAAPLAFDTASVKPAREDAPVAGVTFMIALGKQTPPRGLLTMTAPLAPFIMFAYNVQDEVEARAMRARLPEWAQRQKYTIVARPPQDAPTEEQIRGMMRSLLEDRFGLKAHRENHNGPVQNLTIDKPGVTGPGLKPHDAAQVCIQRESTGTPPASESGKPAPAYCGLELHLAAGGMFHVSMIDVGLPEACTLLGGLAGVLGGRGMDIVVDGTGLQGKWDMTLDFRPERDGPGADGSSGNETGGPTFTAALEKQLGLRLKKGTGQVEALIVDHIAQPTPD
jgi:uncharacterized protein (TIGR03435 family)